MRPDFIPIVVEFLTTLVFIGVLVYLRKSLSPVWLAFWVILWIGRGAVSMGALHLIGGAERLSALLYAPLQIAFAIALVMIAVRLENQKDQLRSLNEELARLRKDAAVQLDFDPLTGLRNRSCLTRWMEEEGNFQGLVVVCDMDDFKQLNDTYGHLVGDEILHGAGKLIGNSIRDEDMAFRWGGDEFVIFFHTQDAALVDDRLHGIENHLQRFHIRQHGSVPVHFSWGITTAGGRPLRESVEEADRLMYEVKRSRRVQQPTGPAN